MDETTKALVPEEMGQPEIVDTDLITIFKQKLNELGPDALREILDGSKPRQKPRVDLKAILHDPEEGIKVDLDWNPEFITYLKQNGVTGADENQIIRRWLAHLSNDIVRDMDEESKVESEFE